MTGIMSITFRATFTTKHGETVVSNQPKRDAFEHYAMCVQRLGATGGHTTTYHECGCVTEGVDGFMPLTFQPASAVARHEEPRS